MAIFKAQVVKWGNDFAVCLPKAAFQGAGIRESDELEICVEKGRLRLQPIAERLTLRDLVAGITPRNLH